LKGDGVMNTNDVNIKEKAVIFFLNQGYSIQSGSYIIKNLTQYNNLRSDEKFKIIGNRNEWCVFHEDKLVVMVN
jgi:hypothetical protein